MARRNVSGRRYARKFNKRRARTKAINAPTHYMRGGYRL